MAGRSAAGPPARAGRGATARQSAARPPAGGPVPRPAGRGPRATASRACSGSCRAGWVSAHRRGRRPASRACAAAAGHAVGEVDDSLAGIAGGLQFPLGGTGRRHQARRCHALPLDAPAAGGVDLPEAIAPASHAFGPQDHRHASRTAPQRPRRPPGEAARRRPGRGGPLWDRSQRASDRRYRNVFQRPCGGGHKANDRHVLKEQLRRPGAAASGR